MSTIRLQIFLALFAAKIAKHFDLHETVNIYVMPMHVAIAFRTRAVVREAIEAGLAPTAFGVRYIAD